MLKRATGLKPCSDDLDIMQNVFKDEMREAMMTIAGETRGFKIHEQRQ
jgi:hypothetical protein